jgi:hypothetical protein
MYITTIKEHPINSCRKNHRCEWCDELIDKGSAAFYRVYVGDGFTSSYAHPECREAMLTMSYADWTLIDHEWDQGYFKRGSTDTNW